ncbi:heparin lyase I family protein [Endozoicomonas sp. SM1973]|uniref:Heparin lyase I family protein n=1 Tax=Spartinivicinus marinus TaxID=2994442 RepID=A0A853IFD9_9GAMM|nr:heparin lyase I family protein [Spartinivicinus marinus]MCX4027548.1 heparin lyase I family protein [Spartinivicinus marinus]NYZ68207.1 heparin lyase I family protein [Spartinivicinus marinus]
MVFSAQVLAQPNLNNSIDDYIQQNCSIDDFEISGKVNPQRYLIDQQCTINLNQINIAPVGVKHHLGRIPDPLYGLNRLSLAAIPVSILPDFGSLADGRQRVEFTTGFFPLSQFLSNQLSMKALQFKAETKSMMAGQWPTSSNYQYYQLRFRLPSVFRDELGPFLQERNQASILADDMSVIIAQWHGTPDRLKYRHETDQPWQYQQLDVRDYSDKGVEQTLSQYHSLKHQGYLFDQGGFPPMALKIKDGYLALIANYYRYPIHDRRLTRCPKISLSGEESATVGKFYICDYKEKQLKPYFITNSINNAESNINGNWASGVSVIWKHPITPSLFDRWITLTVIVNWPNWENDDFNRLRHGRVQLYNTDTGQELADYNGPIGNNDEWAPYFKFGIYKSNKSAHLPVQVDYDLSALYIF